MCSYRMYFDTGSDTTRARRTTTPWAVAPRMSSTHERHWSDSGSTFRVPVSRHTLSPSDSRVIP